MIQIKVNEYQTPITEQLLEIYPEEVRNQFEDMVTNIPLISWLISDKRPRAKDLPRDEYGRIIVDITHPHILEDMDYFRQPALHFLEHGCYTFLRPDGNPKSPYKKFWLEEMRRCRDGYVRESDGEWIPGQLYFFLNYVQILVTVIEEGKKKARKMTTFPHIWEGLYLRFHYLYQARENGSHAIELAKRGCGKSLSLSSIMAHNLLLGEDTLSKQGITTILTAHAKEYLGDKDGTLLKFTNAINFVWKNTPFPHKLLKSSMSDYTWIMGYKDPITDAEMGSRNQVLGVSAQQDADKLRGKRGWILFEEMGCFLAGTKVLMYPNGIKNIEDIKNGDFVMGKDGTPRVVSNYHSGVDAMYKIALSNGDSHIVNSKHIIHYKKLRWDKGEYEYYNKTVEDFIKIPNTDKGYYLEKTTIEYPYQECPIDPYLLGLWLGDGDSTMPSIANGDKEVIEWLSANYDVKIGDMKHCKACKKIYIRNIIHKFSSLGLLNNKHIPDIYLYNSKEVYKQIIAGFVDTDGHLAINAHSVNFEISQRYDRLHLLENLKFMANNLGLRCTMGKRITKGSKKPGVLHYRLRISGDLSIIPTKIKRKQAPERITHYKERRNWQDYTFKVTPYSFDRYYGFEVNKDNLFVLADNTIVHNSFPNLISLYDTTRRSVEDGSYTFALMYLVGTSSQKDSNFASAKTLLYKTKSYNIYTLENVYDKSSQGKETFGYFFPSYMNRTGCYNKDGVSDVVKGLLEILNARYISREADPASILSVIAEDPITPAEAMIKVQDNFFPVAQLSERANQLDSDPKAYDDIYVGNLVFSKGKQLEFKPTEDIPLRKWRLDLQDSKQGALEIYAMPEKSPNGEIIYDRYIVGHDPVDNDSSETTSLSSTFVFDMFTDTIVAEFTGRLPFADDNYEIVRKLCLFYNAKCLYESNLKGLFGYFQRYNCLYLLAETPAHLRDQHYIKYTNFGNSKYGVRANASINNYANRLLRDWLLKPMNVISEEGEITVPTLMTIRNRALIDELINFNPIVNVDRIRAMGMVMLLRQELIVQYQGEVRHEEEIGEDLANDEFFKKNYDDRFGIGAENINY